MTGAVRNIAASVALLVATSGGCNGSVAAGPGQRTKPSEPCVSGPCDGGCPTGNCAEAALPGSSENPTGTCTAPDSGARRGLPPPGEGDVWLPNCNRGPAREYWRVFVRPSGSAYVVPNPTLPPQYFVPACSDQQQQLFDIVARYSFCGVQNPRAGDDMTPADALTLTYVYHQALVFNFYPPGIIPAPILDDVVAACDLGTSEDSPEFQSITCAHARAAYERDGAAGTIGDDDWPGQAGGDLAYRLNQLYGTVAERYTLAIAPELCGLPADPTAQCSSPGPRYFYDPKTASCIERPFGSCGASFADFATEEACRGGCTERAHSCQRCAGTSCASATDCSRCPVTAPTSNSSCSDLNLECDYVRCGPMCTCSQAGDGGLVWSCISLLC